MSAPNRELRPIAPGAIKKWLAVLDEAEGSPDQQRLQDSLWRLREAAAVLTGFDPARLRPSPGSDDFDERARIELLADTVAIEGAPPQFGWRLTIGVRRLALERLKAHNDSDTRGRLTAALAVNAERPSDGTQQLLERAISGLLPSPESVSRAELSILATVVDWLDGIVTGLPSPASMARAIASKELLHPLERLAGSGFVGRDDELRRLSDHVDVLAIDRSVGVITTVAQGGRRALARAEGSLVGARRPLFVYGPGGVGKSSLLARFVLTHQLPFVILDVDRPAIEPLRPLTLLIEALGQLQYQLEGVQGPASELSGRLLASLRVRDTTALESIVDDSEALISAFANLVNPLIAERPLLFVVDTFEEVQFLGADVATMVIGFLARLQRSLPQMRVIISGRLPPDTGRFYTLPLGELPPEAARELLVRAVQEAHGTALRAEQLDELIDGIGGNPMVVCLAARLIADGDLEGVREVGGQRSWLRKVRIEAVQARLFGRILLHIHDRKVRKLAFPGLLLRRVNAELIRNVLAVPCDVDVVDDDEARRLLDLMSREGALVTRDPRDGSLVYRADIRRIALESEASVPDDAGHAIDEGAVRFWSEQSGPQARAEELYHRMRLDQPRTVLEDRWVEGAAPLLRSALGELPESATLWLAGKLGVTVTTDAHAYELQPDWERYAERTARRLVVAGQPADALRILRERSERLEASPLRALEVRALYALDRHDEALKFALEGVRASIASSDAPGEVELRLLCALLLERAGQLTEAHAEARAAAAVAEQAGLREALLRALVRLLRIERRMGATNGPEYESNHRRASAVLAALGVSRVEGDASLLRDVAAEIGSEEPDLLYSAVDRLGVEVLRTTPRSRLGELFERGGFFTPDVLRSVIGGNLGEIAKIASAALMSALGGTSAHLATELVVELFREASDRALNRERASDEGAVEPPRRGVKKPNDGARRLSGPDLEGIADLIVHGLTRDALRRTLRVYLSRDLETYTSPSNAYAAQVLDVVTAADTEGWLAEFVRALSNSDTENGDLRRGLEQPGRERVSEDLAGLTMGAVARAPGTSNGRSGSSTTIRLLVTAVAIIIAISAGLLALRAAQFH